MFSWIGLSGLHDAAKQYTFLYSVFYNNSSSLANGSAFALFFLAGMNSMVLTFLYAIHEESVSRGFKTVAGNLRDPAQLGGKPGSVEGAMDFGL